MVIGKKIGNRYEIIDKLGSGGMSIVYKGLDTVLNRLVTIKVLREQYASNEDFVRRFRREAQSVASLSHTNIVSIYDVGFEDDKYYLVMEFVEGQNLKEFIKQKGKVPANEAVPIAMQILDALQHAHEHGVVHRDIKPHNILITNDGRVRVTDFGIARAADEATVTYTGTIVGSVHYISPEQAKGISISAQSDIYSAGVVLFEMITGQLPFNGDSPIAIALQHIQNEPVSPSDLVQDISPELSFVILKAMRKDPSLRYDSAREMCADLEKIQLGKANEIEMNQRKTDFNDDTLIIPAIPAINENQDNKPEKRQKKKPKSKGFFIATGAFLLFLFILVGYAGMNGFFNVGETTVPNLEGKPLEQAKRDLEEAKLLYELQYSFNNMVEKDYVISQSIPGGKVVKKNRIISLIVSKGPKMIAVPDVRGKTQREAEVEINNRGLKVSFTENYSNEVSQGFVVSQDPGANSEVPEGSVVSVVISAGVEPKYMYVPDLIRKTLEEAKRLLSISNFKVGKVSYQESSEIPANQVISQYPKENTKRREWSSVNIVVSKGPGSIEEPDSESDSPEKKFARVTYEVPGDSKEHKLQIIVHDESGTHKEYDQVQQPGNLVVHDTPYYGKGEICIYLDEKLVSSQDVP
ncbi:MAG: Stk1 family PASTA domain-containing Ser/Thr kinase [Bacillota bacterium]|jgi:serine/threonine protein kinase